ncbi:MAG: 3-isopropylmalate dehydratase large subunit [Microbacterium sp.]
MPPAASSSDAAGERPRTLYEKIWEAHVIERLADDTCLIAVDRQLVYEYTSRPAFESLKTAGRRVRRPSSTLAMSDHAVPTRDRDRMRPGTLRVLDQLRLDCAENGIPLLELDDPRHGIVHVVGPEQGFTQPGLVMACPDSHTSSHGALGALAFGIGSTELEHVLATQTLVQRPARGMRITVEGRVGDGVSAKDLALALIGVIGVRGGVGHAIEFAGPAIAALAVAGRLTVCNMAVEAGSRSALIAPDEVTFEWLDGRPMAPTGQQWDRAVAYWRTLASDDGARFDREVRFDASALEPQVTWGTSPDQVVGVSGRVPDPDSQRDEVVAATHRRALEYMGLEAGRLITDIPIDRVFIGSCTNSRLDDLRSAAAVLRGRHLAAGVRGMVVPGSGIVKAAAEREGLHEIFAAAGLEWRDAGCSMCFGSVHDSVAPGERCASTSNRNFENRQGAGARTHLLSPAMAAAAGVAGHFVDARTFDVDTVGS